MSILNAFADYDVSALPDAKDAETEFEVGRGGLFWGPTGPWGNAGIVKAKAKVMSLPFFLNGPEWIERAATEMLVRFAERVQGYPLNVIHDVERGHGIYRSTEAKGLDSNEVLVVRAEPEDVGGWVIARGPNRHALFTKKLKKGSVVLYELYAKNRFEREEVL